MTARALADAVVMLHALFVVFALLGGALVLWQPRIAIAHLPAAAWAAWVEFTGTDLSVDAARERVSSRGGRGWLRGRFRRALRRTGALPEGLTPRMQVALGVIVVALNALFYGFAWRRSGDGGAKRSRPISRS